MKKSFLILAVVLFLGFNGMGQTVKDSIIAPTTFILGDNDVFEAKSEKGSVVSLKIYCRWNRLVFSEEAKKCRWDARVSNGKRIPSGVYHYVAEINSVSPKITKKGTITVK